MRHLSFGKYCAYISSFDKFSVLRHFQIGKKKFPPWDWKNFVWIEQEYTNNTNNLSENENQYILNVEGTDETENEHIEEGRESSNSQGGVPNQ